MTELKRDLGIWAALAIVVGTVIGSGIFRVPQAMILNVGSVPLVFLVWVVGGLLSLAGALTYAELAAAMPGAGGEYVYLTEAYGPMWGFLYSWTQMWVAKSGSIATLATAFFEYTAHFVPQFEVIWFTAGPFPVKYGQVFALVLILLLGGINYLGVRIGGDVQVAVTCVKVALIAVVILAGLFYAHPASASAAVPLPAQTSVFAGFIAALVGALWAYDGWNNVGMVASEVRNPQKNLPLALIGGTLGVIAIYMLANWAYFRVLSPAEVGAHKLVAAEMMQRIAGSPGANAVSIAAMISIFAALNGSILTGARVPYAAARDGLFFRSAARVHPAFHTPGVSILMLHA
jgi:APA family basic amino acid/polyamine antiporter